MVLNVYVFFFFSDNKQLQKKIKNLNNGQEQKKKNTRNSRNKRPTIELENSMDSIHDGDVDGKVVPVDSSSTSSTTTTANQTADKKNRKPSTSNENYPTPPSSKYTSDSDGV